MVKKDGESEEFQWDSQTKDLKNPPYGVFPTPIDCVSHRENRFFPYGSERNRGITVPTHRTSDKDDGRHSFKGITPLYQNYDTQSLHTVSFRIIKDTYSKI